MSVKIQKNGTVSYSGTEIGENLIANSAPVSLAGWSKAGTGWSISLVPCDISPTGYAVRGTHYATTSDQGGPHKQPIDYTLLENGKIYTLSVYLRASKSLRVNCRSENMTSYSLAQPFTVTTEWKRYVISGPVSLTTTYHSDIFYVYGADAEYGTWIEVCMPKLEKGSHATPWTPAPSDYISTNDVIQSGNLFTLNTVRANSNSTVTITDDVINVQSDGATYGCFLQDSRLALKNGRTYRLSGHIKVITKSSDNYTPILCFREHSTNLIKASVQVSGTESDVSVLYKPGADISCYISGIITWTPANTNVAEVEYSNIKVVEERYSIPTGTPQGEEFLLSEYQGMKENTKYEPITFGRDYLSAESFYEI